MSESPKPTTSWWQTLPGVLTALAATITAISGLMALLFQNGVFAGKADARAESQPIPQVVASAPASPSVHQSASAITAPAGKVAKPWSDVEAVLLGKDGKTTRVRADSLSNCISANHEMSLDNGQSIPFEKLSGLDVVQADDHANSTAKARLKLMLSDGTELSGTVDANCDLFGYNDLGRFTTYFDHLRSIRFE